MLGYFSEIKFLHNLGGDIFADFFTGCEVEAGKPKDFKLDKIPEYLRDTVDWFMG